MSNQLEFEICINRVRVYNELISETIKRTGAYLEDCEIEINFAAAGTNRYAELVGHKLYFKCFLGGMHCNVYRYDGQQQIESWIVPVNIIKFKEYQ